MSHNSYTCLHCSGTGKKPGLLDADQQRPQCIRCEGKGTIPISDEPMVPAKANNTLIKMSSTLLLVDEDPSWPDGPEQLDLFE